MFFFAQNKNGILHYAQIMSHILGGKNSQRRADLNEKCQSMRREVTFFDSLTSQENHVGNAVVKVV